MSAAKAPPVLKSNGNYSAWKHQIEAWELLTDIPEEKRALAVYLQGLEGDYKDVVSKIELADLNKKGGVKVIIELLNRYCDSQKSHKQYEVYERVHDFRRGRGENLQTALLRFESLVMDMGSLDMKLPTPVLAFHVLKSMNIGAANETLVRATVTGELTYENMLTQIRAVTDLRKLEEIKKEDSENLGFGEMKIEAEDTLYSRGQSWMRRGRGFRLACAARNSSGGARFGGARFGGDRLCYKCGAPDHLSYNCPNTGSVNAGAVGGNVNTGTVSASGGGDYRGRCFKCQSPDHFAYACPMPSNGNNGPINSTKIILLEI